MWVKVTYCERAPIAVQEKPHRLGGDDESESGSTARDDDPAPVAEPPAIAEPVSGVSELPEVLLHWVGSSTTYSRLHSDRSATNRPSNSCAR